MALTAVGVAATLGVFGAAGRTTVISQNTEVRPSRPRPSWTVVEAQVRGAGAHLEPGHLGRPQERQLPRQRNCFNVRSGLTEPLVTTAGDGATAKVDPGPTTFAVGQNGSTITGKVYRYVTWRDENCPTTICDGAENTKRVIVAVSLDPVANTVQRNPLWFSTVISDPSATPRATGTAGGNGSGTGAARARRSSTCTTSPATMQSGTVPGTRPNRQPRHAQHGSDQRVGVQQLHLRQRRSDEAAGRDGDAACDRHQHADLRVLGGSRRRLSRRPRDDAQGDHLPDLVLVVRGSPERGSPSTTGYKFAVHSWATPRDGGRGVPSQRAATVSMDADPRWPVRQRLPVRVADRAPRERRRPGHHDRLDHLRRLRLAVDSPAG